MEDNRCFKSGCTLNIEYECPCSFPTVYACKLHAFKHLLVPNKNHALKSIFGEPCEKTKEAILLPKYDSIEDFNNKCKEKEKIQRNNKNIIVEEDIGVSKSEISESLKSSEEWKLKVFHSTCKRDFSVDEKSATQAYLDVFITYQQKPYLFHLVEKDDQTNLLIYNAEIESQDSIILDTPQPLDFGTCITQLPNGKLFCFGNNNPFSGITALIDENYKVQELPSGTLCALSSAIYFNNNVYCFGGGYDADVLTLSSRFDLDKNQWNELTPLPKPDYGCNSLLFNGSILISGWYNKNLLRYSIDNNSFSTIPYDFAEFKRKILIKAERLYLIECMNGSIYESEIGSDTAWRKITNNSTIDFTPDQTYCQPTEKEIYIGCTFCYFKFSFTEKRLIGLKIPLKSLE